MWVWVEQPFLNVMQSCQFVYFVTKIVWLIFADCNDLIFFNCKGVVVPFAGLVVIPITKEYFHALFDDIFFHAACLFSNNYSSKTLFRLVYRIEVKMKNNFLKWWLLNATVLACCVLASFFGVAKEVYLKDSSYLTFVIIAIYFLCSGWNGYLSWSVDKKNELREEDTDTGWFLSEILLSLGMIGTVVGFIQMLSGFGVKADGVKGLQELLSTMSYGMSTALYTTLGGLIFGNLLKLQCFILEKNLKGSECRGTETTEAKQAS